MGQKSIFKSISFKNINFAFFTESNMSGKSAFNEDQIAEFQEVFTLFDTVGDGMIPVSKILSCNLHTQGYWV